jgi:hypothetical protein
VLLRLRHMSEADVEGSTGELHGGAIEDLLDGVEEVTWRGLAGNDPQPSDDQDDGGGRGREVPDRPRDMENRHRSAVGSTAHRDGVRLGGETVTQVGHEVASGREGRLVERRDRMEHGDELDDAGLAHLLAVEGALEEVGLRARAEVHALLVGLLGG